jgi:hypothetical protein
MLLRVFGSEYGEDILNGLVDSISMRNPTLNEAVILHNLVPPDVLQKVMPLGWENLAGAGR